MSEQQKPNPPAPEPGKPDPPWVLALRNFQSVIDRRIADAEANGLFKDLPGAGKPLDLDDDSLVPEEDRAAYRMLKNGGFAPPWIELQKSIFEEQAKLATWLERANRRWSSAGPLEQQRLRAEYQGRITDLNRMITNYNLSAPPVAGQLALLQPWRELPKLGSVEH